MSSTHYKITIVTELLTYDYIRDDEQTARALASNVMSDKVVRNVTIFKVDETLVDQFSK